MVLEDAWVNHEGFLDLYLRIFLFYISNFVALKSTTITTDNSIILILQQKKEKLRDKIYSFVYLLATCYGELRIHAIRITTIGYGYVASVQKIIDSA